MKLQNALLLAASELKQLRSENAIMRAQLDIVEVFKAALLGRPSQGWGSSQDVVPVLEGFAAQEDDMERSAS